MSLKTLPPVPAYYVALPRTVSDRRCMHDAHLNLQLTMAKGGIASPPWRRRGPRHGRSVYLSPAVFFVDGASLNNHQFFKFNHRVGSGKRSTLTQ